MNDLRSGFKAGLALAGVLAVLDLASPWLFGADTVQGEGSPPAVLNYLGVVLGVLTLVGIALVWTGRQRVAGFWLVVVTRILSALSAVPGLLFAPIGLKVIVGVWIAVTVVILVLLFRNRGRVADEPLGTARPAS